ncbi:MAG: LptE family protein [Planctomycetia bacterium]|nr:LptE family protein [Planctomycetia bacterium]
MSHVFFRSFLILALLISGGCATYHVGNGNLFSSQVQSVGVSICGNETWRRGYGERLTEALVREINTRTPYKVVPASRADTVLEVKIVSERKNVTFQNKWADPRELTMDVIVEAQWVDRRTNELRQSQNINLESLAVQVSGTSQMITEAGQSNATTSQKIMETLAKQIIGMMEMAW